MTKIIYITRPMGKPWDEASKNLAYNIYKKININSIILLGRTDNNAGFEKVYKGTDFGIKNKLNLIKFLIKNRNKNYLFHSFFSPTLLNSYLLRFAIPNERLIQTVPTIYNNKISKNKAKKVYGGDIVVCFSKYTSKYLMNFGINNKIIRPGIDTDYFSPQEPDKDLRVRLGINENTKTILYAGEYGRMGSFDWIFYMVNKLKMNHRFKIIISGRELVKKHKKKMKRIVYEIKKRNLENYFIITKEDEIKNMKKLYSLVDFSIFPFVNMIGKFDFPLVILESMAMGKPVLVSDNKLMHELFNENKKFISESKEEFTLKVNNYLSGINQKDKEQSRSIIKNSFNIKETASKYKNIYEEKIGL